MNMNAINAGYYSYQSSKPETKVSAKDDTKAASSSLQESGESKVSKESNETKSNGSSAYSQVSATYEKSNSNSSYQSAVQGMTSSKDRSAIIAQLKSDSQQRLASMQSLVTQMFQKQGITIGKADDMWKVLASGKFTADDATIKQAKEDISEDGYWGVSQTSDRIFSFALALSGGDEAKMKTMVNAVQKGFKEATKTWGQKLPSISQDTLSATMDKFDQWFKDNSSSVAGSDTATEANNASATGTIEDMN